MKNRVEEMVKYDITEAVLSEMSSQFLILKVENYEDKDNYNICKDAYKVVRGKRLEVEARRKELKADSLAFGRLVDSKANEIFCKLEPIENHLKEQVKIVDDHKKRLQDEINRKAAEKLAMRTSALQKIGRSYLPEFAFLSDDSFQDMIDRETKERDRELAEQMAKDAELERLRKLEAEVQEKLRAEQIRERELQAKALAEQQALIAKQKAEIMAKEKVEADRILAEKKAKLEAEKAAEKEIADKAQFQQIKKTFPTLELCWVEIARLQRIINLR